MLFDALVGKFRRSADRSGNRVLHLVARNRDISLLFHADPTGPRAALDFQVENLTVWAYRIGAKTGNASLDNSLVLVPFLGCVCRTRILEDPGACSQKNIGRCS